MKCFNYFSYRQNSNLVINVELPGVDPSTVKLSYENQMIYLNGEKFEVSKHYDLSLAEAALKNGLLKITVPEKVISRPEIPIKVN